MVAPSNNKEEKAAQYNTAIFGGTPVWDQEHIVLTCMFHPQK